ncbi:MAG: TRAP transporter fused permease subunit [Clostridiales bacterium]|nr:TRAP transporter fused permease subunit [Candidatus Apopatocola equi]MCQ2439693.1 TRAP transporter fused permease subunit [Oscillospiraceae bacterium]
MSDKHNAVDAAALDEVMKKYDRESNTRIWEGWQKWAVYGVMAAVSVFVIYVTLFATWLDLVRYPSFLGAMLFIGYLIYPAKKGVQKVNHIPWYDLVIMVLGTAAFFYVVVNAKDLTVRLGVLNVKKYEIYIGIVGVLAVMELCRRSTGIPILCVASAFLIYAIYYYVGVKGLGAWKATRQLTIGLFYNTTGLLTTPIQVCSKFIVVFIVFGAFLERTGISNFFIDLANSAAGAAAGGPAKVAVISSALCGMVSGSSVGNTVTTGSVTIPMMQRTGYKGEFAGAVEAAASTGGQIMPPIMGAAAFLMADYVGVPYSDIIGRAILPAFLYFAGIFISVHLEAKKLGLKGIDRSELPTAVSLVKKLYLLLPLIILVYLVSSGKRTMAFAAAISVVFTVVVSNLESTPLPSGLGILLLLVYLFAPLNEGVGAVVLCMGLLLTAISMLKKDAKMTPALFFDALASGAKGSISVAAACGIAGIIAGCITMTGLASQIISVIIRISGGTKIVALVLTMLCCIVLGMGVPTTANYCIMASTCAPILIQIGIPRIAAHFFVFYFGIVADITPPVALAAYAGAAIAKANPMKTAFNATKLAIAAFIIPYMLAYNPAMVLVDTNAVEIVMITATSLAGMFGVGMALEGYFMGRLNPVLRILAGGGGLMLIYPGTLTDIIGCALVGGVVAFMLLQERKNRGAAAA